MTYFPPSLEPKDASAPEALANPPADKVCLDCYKAMAHNWSLYDKVELAEALGTLAHEYQQLLWELNRKQDQIDAARSKA